MARFKNIKSSHGILTVILQYYTERFQDYWHILYPGILLKKRLQDPFLYFWDISRKAIEYQGPFSEEGIYLFKGYDGQYHLHALEVTVYTIGAWCAWKNTQHNYWKDKALKHCDWLLTQQESDGAWRTQHKNPIYDDLPCPWPSALTQGLAISSLVRAYRVTSDKKYLHSACNAANFLQLDISQDGTRREIECGFILEEYPVKKLSGVLNGYITAILGLYELSQFKNEYLSQFEQNFENLKKILPLYDAGFWSFYSLDGNYASGFYHRFHITQLSILSELDDYFLQYKNKFESYLNNNWFATKALSKKIF
jgi:hypothetical protein